MRKFIGISCIFLGFVLIACAVGLVVYNKWEDKNAKTISKSLLEEVQIAIGEEKPENDEAPENPMDDTKKTMDTVNVDGDECIGILSIPALELELPVLTNWSYEKLKKAPCHYFGSCYEKDFVIAAHNYTSHFARLSALSEKDVVIFTDVHGNKHYYEVVLTETLPENATEEMITAGFDLSLYTCTLGGDNRITVRCKRIESAS